LQVEASETSQTAHESSKDNLLPPSKKIVLEHNYEKKAVESSQVKPLPREHSYSKLQNLIEQPKVTESNPTTTVEQEVSDCKCRFYQKKIKQLQRRVRQFMN
jgi:hypothetical protein